MDRTVLVAIEDQAALRFTEMVLRRTGYRVTGGTNEAEVLMASQEGAEWIDAAILDRRLLPLLNRLYPAVPLVVRDEAAAEWDAAAVVRAVERAIERGTSEEA